MASYKQVAVNLARKGYYVLPIRQQAKKPPLVEHGCHSASNDVRQVQEWWDEHPRANIAIATGPSRLLVLDVDLHKAGVRDAWNIMVNEHPELVETQVIESANKGLHLYYSIPEGMMFPSRPNAIGKGIDVKAEGGYVLVPPSNVGRGQYKLIRAVPIATMPEYLVELLREEHYNQQPTGRVVLPPDELRETMLELVDVLPELSTKRLNNYDDWLHVGMALKNGLGDAGLNLWLGWSKNSDFWDEEECHYRWDTFRDDGQGYTLASIFFWANEDQKAAEQHELETINMMLNGDYAPIDIDDLANLDDVARIQGTTRWAWKNWIPQGRLTMIVGAIETGKSSFALRIVESFYTGKNWPDGQPYEGETGKVLWVEAEAGQDDTLARADKWGIPREAIVYPFKDPHTEFDVHNPEHILRIRRIVANPGIVATIVDSLSGIHMEDEQSQAMIRVMRPFIQTAQIFNKPVLVSHHATKDDEWAEMTKKRIRGAGSIAQQARSIIAIDTPDRSDLEFRRIRSIKLSGARKPVPIGMEFDLDDGTPVFSKEYPHVNATPPDAEKETLLNRVCRQIVNLLENAPNQTMLTVELRELVNRAFADRGGISAGTWGTAAALVSDSTHLDGEWARRLKPDVEKDTSSFEDRIWIRKKE